MGKLDDLTKGLVDVYTKKLTQQQQEELMACLQVLADDQKYNKFNNYFPDEGEFRRELYKKQVSFFNAGGSYKERCFIAANRVGKSEAGAYEVTCHATGVYPHWWTGLRYTRPILIWVGGDTATTVRDIIQKKLIGEVNDMGSGMLPKEKIIKEECKSRRNVPDAMEILRVRHITGGTSTIVLKTYEQGRATWQGTEVDFIWVDEEPPEDVYGEALIRLMTTKGSIITTYTPLQGVTPLVLSMLDNSQETEAKYPKWVEICTWDDVPHLTAEEKEKTLLNTPPQLRDARSRGVPTVGTGLVYPVDPKFITVDDFQIPKHFKKLYALDVGWNNTAAIWGAWDADNDIIYIYSEHKQGQAEPVVHAKAIKARGEWIRGVIDPAARGRSQIDGEKLFDIYGMPESRGGCGLKLVPANNAVEAGIFIVWERLTTGRLKIFKSCTGVLRELSLYHRDDNGKIVKSNDHLLDCLRYLNNSDKSLWSYPEKEGPKQKVVDINKYMQACV
jgi:phage terminase large subunit-like protein